MILNVRYYSQFRDTINPEWKNNACGIAALKMVLDFYHPTSKNIDDLYQAGLNIHGFLENVGWYHHSLVNIAKSLGFKGITRSWNIKEENRQTLKSRGFNDKDIEILENQQLEEALFTLKNEINKNHPIIVPVTQGFEEKGSGHLVVLIGYDEEGFYFNDPDDQKRDGKQVKVNIEDFCKVFTKRAIIISPLSD